MPWWPDYSRAPISEPASLFHVKQGRGFAFGGRKESRPSDTDPFCFVARKPPLTSEWQVWQDAAFDGSSVIQVRALALAKWCCRPSRGLLSCASSGPAPFRPARFPVRRHRTPARKDSGQSSDLFATWGNFVTDSLTSNRAGGPRRRRTTRWGRGRLPGSGHVESQRKVQCPGRAKTEPRRIRGQHRHRTGSGQESSRSGHTGSTRPRGRLAAKMRGVSARGPRPETNDSALDHRWSRRSARIR